MAARPAGGLPAAGALAIDPNVPYTITVSTGEDADRAYPFVPDGFISADNNTKHLSYPASAGVLTTSLGTRPTQAPNGNSYLRDIVFHPAAEGARFTIGNTTDATQADHQPDAKNPTGTNGRAISMATSSVTMWRRSPRSKPRLATPR
jgi:hypothetical protein